MTIHAIHSIDEMPDLDEMIEASSSASREDMIVAIVERIYEDWDCHLLLDEVRAHVAHEVDAYRS